MSTARKNFKYDFLRDEFHSLVKTHPDYSNYVESLNEESNDWISDEPQEKQKARTLVKKMIRTDGSLDRILNLCENEVKILEQANSQNLT